MHSCADEAQAARTVTRFSPRFGSLGVHPLINLPSAGVQWAVVSGLGYGFGLAIVIEVSEASGAWPAVAQRVSALILIAGLVLRSTGGLPVVGVRTAGILAGLVAGMSTVFYLVGVQADPTPAVVLASMFPAVTVVVGRVIFHDPVARLQVVGLVVVLFGVVGVVTN